MPLLIVCGQPCSGKSTITQRLAEKIKSLGTEVVVIDERTIALDRNAAFQGMNAAQTYRYAEDGEYSSKAYRPCTPKTVTSLSTVLKRSIGPAV